ncbi:MAG: hypothetical protein V8Q75_02990 [Bacilli bacterium]
MNLENVININLIRQIKDNDLVIFYNQLLEEREVVNRLIIENEYVGYRDKVVDLLLEITLCELNFRKIKLPIKVLTKKIS